MKIDYRLGEMAKVFSKRYSNENLHIELEKEYGGAWWKHIRNHEPEVAYAKKMVEASRIARRIKAAFDAGWCLACEAKDANTKPVKKAKKGAKR